MSDRRSYTGFIRSRKTPWSVKAGDAIAGYLIGIGGVGTIIAVLTVCIFLVWVVVPLFLPAKVVDERSHAIETSSAIQPVRILTDDYLNLAAAVFPDGELKVITLADGTLLERRQLFEEDAPLVTAAQFSRTSNDVIFGFEDGRVRTGTLGFQATFLHDDQARRELAGLQPGDTRVYRDGVVARTEELQLRHLTLRAELQDYIDDAHRSPVRQVDQIVRSNQGIIAVLHDDGMLTVNSVRSRRNLMTGEVALQVRSAELPRIERPGPPPEHMLLAGLGDKLYLIWGDGHLARYDTRNLNEASIAEELNLLDDPQARLTAAEFLIGRTTIVVGDSRGRIRAWFPTQPQGAITPDGEVLTPAHQLLEQGPEVSAFDVSSRTRLVTSGHADGTVRVFNVTADNHLITASAPAAAPVAAITLAPRNNAVLAWTNHGLSFFELNLRHPAITPASLIRPVWYESFNEPSHMWQSSAGSDAFEPKYGLWPLIFGTLKATFYSMIFAVPLALLAAIYTSEFLHPRMRSRIKPTIEMMASLPSVVLGFLAGIVMAPFVENWVPAVLALFITLPIVFITGAFLWQHVPHQLALRYAYWKPMMMVALTPVGIVLAVPVGLLLEKLFFAGDIRAWLDGQVGSGTGGWVFILFPVSAVAAAFLTGRYGNDYLKRISRGWSREKFALVDSLKFLIALILTLVIAILSARVLTMLGFDPRGTVVDTYSQRNALIVGFVMGFAVIPIIYTIAEDALNAVPSHLRSASLGAGATPWQTAMRIVVPTAMSGLFSAIMIGLGRAVGETMIVLMAAGNTPVLELNIFNGFRTLSANIAVELPEAVRNSTHYRTLFLAALVLFVMTFIINTVAELIRLRFRKKAVEL